MALSLRTPGINLPGEAVSKYLELCEVENHMNDLEVGCTQRELPLKNPEKRISGMYCFHSK